MERTVIAAIKNDIAVFASHTNLDNIINGVNGKIAAKLGLKNITILQQKRAATLQKLYTFVPKDHIDNVRDALFAAGAGHISNYSECSFTQSRHRNIQSRRRNANLLAVKIGETKYEEEIKIEVILPGYLKSAVLKALFDAHPYEEVAYDLVNLDNGHPGTGAGIIGEIEPVSETDFLILLHASVQQSRLYAIPPLTGKTISKVAVCGGAGSFLISKALSAGADVFVTGDVKYHEFFDAEGRMLLCDIGHYESEQFTTDLFIELLREKFPTFAVLKSEVNTNPVHVFHRKITENRHTHMANVKDYSVEEKLSSLVSLQKVESKIDEVQVLKGELPMEVSDLEDEITGLQARQTRIEEEINGIQEFINQKKELDQGS